MTKIPVHEALDDSDLYSWEDSFGVDFPEYLPYWVKYMSQPKRLRYLAHCGDQFKDFSPEMLNSHFDWDNWQHTSDAHGYVDMWNAPVEPQS